ncbi:hypothetical protein [Microvirga tunisiensis]|uniref:Uncharacterized protein n=1 Tax=Microvirga tunisiensis TaxID=2108360 RepID=A0A5N7MJ63_9HYPH|nr:hypothetical protein [Microvirga tunisiensis]MPR08938.1 hypothetical protein [Microvirga tunisiensis]MPR27132.1 hypothetical protein [Microvirga tunisiensis]
MAEHVYLAVARFLAAILPVKDWLNLHPGASAIWAFVAAGLVGFAGNNWTKYYVRADRAWTAVIVGALTILFVALSAPFGLLSLIFSFTGAQI